MSRALLKLPPRQITKWVAILAIPLCAVVVWALVNDGSKDRVHGRLAEDAAKSSDIKPALAVTTTTPERVEWLQVLPANGSIAAWQEAVIGAEVTNYRLTDVLVNVGDRVKKGQLLARFANATVMAELAQSQALRAEAEAMLTEARANAERARSMQATGFFSAQQINLYLTAEQTAMARLKAARARVQADELRLSQTRVLAPDDGVISARSAAVGSLGQPGEELFRLIRGGRLEWRAEVREADLGKIKPGVLASLITADGERIEGRVRMVAPTVDPRTRNGLVYVDLDAGDTLRAGTFARGEFELGRGPALTLPQSAVLLRDGFAYVFRLEGKRTVEDSGLSKVVQTKVTLGRRTGERVEVTSGIEPAALIVASGAGFLADGDLVRVVEGARPAAKATP